MKSAKNLRALGKVVFIVNLLATIIGTAVMGYIAIDDDEILYMLISAGIFLLGLGLSLFSMAVMEGIADAVDNTFVSACKDGEVELPFGVIKNLNKPIRPTLQQPYISSDTSEILGNVDEDSFKSKSEIATGYALVSL